MRSCQSCKTALPEDGLQIQCHYTQGENGLISESLRILEQLVKRDCIIQIFLVIFDHLLQSRARA